jgi:alpha-L-rhamnosidase
MDGRVSAWSRTGRFSVGLLDEADWDGQWIKHPTAAPERHIWFRKEVNIERKPGTAFAFVASQGYHELYVNGRKADCRVLAPAVSRNDRRVLYVTYDIAPLLSEGRNVIAVWYGAGWTRNNYFAPLVNQALLIRVSGDTDGGGAFSFVTDSTWKCAESYSGYTGGYRFMDMGGEQVDGRAYTEEWNGLSFDDGGWVNADVVSPLRGDGGPVILSSQLTDQSTIRRAIAAKSVTDTVPGFFRVDMGEHFTGYLEAKFRGLRWGDTVWISVSEKTYATHNGQDLHPSGRVGDETVEDHRQGQVYIARGEDGEVFRNRFNYFSGRYIHFRGLRSAPDLCDVTGYAISSAPCRTAVFSCSDTLYNRIFEADLSTFEMCHTEGVIVDCPNRERLGYGPEGAYQTTWGLGLPCFESGAYYVKNLRDWADVQRSDGFINNVAPQISIMYGCVLNGTAGMNIALEHFRKYGDTTVLRSAEAVGRRWLEFLSSHVRDGVLTRYGRHGYFLGDWVAPGPVFEYGESEEALFFNNCVYAISLRHYLDIVSCGGLGVDTAVYCDRLDTLRRSLHDIYYDPRSGIYLNGDQVRTTCALYAGLVPDSLVAGVLGHLADDLSGAHPYINVGSFGRYPFYKTILRYDGFYELLDSVLSRRTYPGYGYFIESGCNVFPETWEIANSNTAFTHTSYAGISAWFLKGLSGIEFAASDRRVMVTPHLVSRLTFVDGGVDTPYGMVRSGWRRDSSRVSYCIEIPVGLDGVITLPSLSSGVMESGVPLSSSRGVHTVREIGDRTVITVGAGRYVFDLSL